jgi:HAD superfamily hydrolase (TIGR01484 family)
MRYFALATDFDGTLATHGHVDEPSIAALRRLAASGRKLLMVTGRELTELAAAFPELDLFDWVVAENGAVLFQPSTGEERLLAEAPTVEFLATIRNRGVSPVSMGRVIVATWTPHEVAVLESIRDLGLELNVIFNKGAVMVLPAGVTKATGLLAALRIVGLSPHNVVGIGDAENDHALLAACGCSAAVANALPVVKERADIVTAGDHGTGVIEIIDRLLANDLADVPVLPGRRNVHFLVEKREHRLPAFGVNLRFVESDTAGCSAAATAFVDALVQARFQFCLAQFHDGTLCREQAVVLGAADSEPTVDEVLAALADPAANVIVKLSALKASKRPAYLADLLAKVAALRESCGRPHWLLIDDVAETDRAVKKLPPGGVALVGPLPGTSPEIRSPVEVLTITDA